MRSTKRTPLGKFIDERLYLIGKSKDDLSKESGLSLPAIYNIVAGRAQLSIPASKKIAPVLGVDDMELRRLASLNKSA